MYLKRVHPLTRVEGNAEVTVKIHRRKLQELELNLPTLRKFENLLCGKIVDIVPLLVAKICGVCPFSHQVAASIALEKALNVDAPPLASNVRRLVLAMEHARSHAYNVFLMGLQDSARLLGLNEKELVYRLFRSGLNIIRFTNKVLSSIAGGSVSPGISTVGGLLKMPDAELLTNHFRKEAQRTLEGMYWALNLSKNLTVSKYSEVFNLEEMPILVTSVGEDCDPMANTLKIHEEEYWKELDDLAYIKGLLTEGVFTGPLARAVFTNLRLKVEWQTSNLLNLYMLRILEIMNALSYSVNLLRDLKDLEARYRENPQGEGGFGRCFVEAPRGTLIYECEVEKDIVKNIKIITPTEINLPFIKMFSRKIIEKTLAKGLALQEAIENLKTAIRMFDPCVSCTTHVTVIDS
jgi:coenzyme F420-reducing hydrogenase alpha subunit